MQLSSAADETLNNASVIQLQALGLGDDVVVEKIRASKCNFDTSADALQKLKDAKVSAAVILAMIKSQAPASVSSTPSGSVKIQLKTPVRLLVEETLSSGTAKSGEPLKLLVAEDVLVESHVVIAKGAPASGRTTAVKKKSFPNYNGKIEFTVDSVRAVDGQTISLEGHVSVGGEGTSFGRFAKDVDLKGHSFTAVVNGEKEVKPQKSASKKVQDPDEKLPAK